MSDFSAPLKLVKTRKPHNCSAWESLVNSGLGEHDLEADEWKHYQRMVNQKGIIPAGSECYYSTGKCDGEMFNSWYNKDIDDICIKYDLYRE